MGETIAAAGTVASAWPLAGSDDLARVPPEWRTRVAQRLENGLRRHVVEAWYPRTVDMQLGGFKTDFDRRWQPTGPDERMLEYQARSTRSVARLDQAYPAEPQWLEYTRHGLRYMTDVMRDSADGGWFWLVGRDGKPLALGTKHAHSTAYVITALVEVYRQTGDPSALDLAQQTFEWLDDALHDKVNGGYHGWATRDGRPILDRSEVAGWQRTGDPLGHDIGLKDINVHSDLMDSFRLLSAEASSPRLAERSRELYELVDTKFTTSQGIVHYVLTPDLQPVAEPEQPGYGFQSAYRMRLFAPYAGVAGDDALESARRLVEHGLKVGWRADGGGIADVAGERSRRSWWVQTEAALALALLAVASDDEQYRERLDEMLGLFEREMEDARYGGWHQVPESEWTLLERLRPRRMPKSHRWKDPSHETDMSLMIIRMMRGLPDGAPLAP